MSIPIIPRRRIEAELIKEIYETLVEGFGRQAAAEVIAQSDKGFDDAVQNAVAEAAKTIRGIRSVWIDNFKCEVKDDRIVEYRVNAKISFVVEGHR